MLGGHKEKANLKCTHFLYQCNKFKKKEKKKHLVWMQDTGFLQQLVCATFHIVVIILLSLRLQQPRQHHSPWFDSRLSTSWTRVEGRERTSASSCNLRSCLFFFPPPHFWLVHFPSLLKGTLPERGSPLLCSKLAGEFIKVAGQALEHQNKVSCPSWLL